MISKLTLPTLNTFLLVAILTLALLLRLWGINFGLPYVGYHDDEPFLADSALELLRKDKIDLSLWYIGGAQVYLQAGIGKILFALYDLEPNQIPTYKEIILEKNIKSIAIGVPYPLPEYYLWGRVSVAILGTFSIFVLYLIGKEIKSSQVGLISAFFLTVTSLHVEHSHYITRDVPGTLFLLLSFYIILQAYLKQKWQYYLLSLISIYIAIYIKQNNLILILPLSLALALLIWGQFRHRSLREMLNYTGVIFLSILLITGLLWLFLKINPLDLIHNIIIRVFYNSYIYSGTGVGISSTNTPLWLIQQLFLEPSNGWRLLVLLALPGLFLAMYLKEKSGWLILSIVIPYLLMMSSFSIQFIRWLMPIIPFFALLAALSLEWSYQRLRQLKKINQRQLVAFYALIIFIIPAASIRAAIVLNYYASQPDIRNIASQWMEINLPPGSKVVIDSWGPYLSGANHEVVYTDFIGEQDLQIYRNEQVDYLIVNAITLSRLVAARSDARLAEFVVVQTKRYREIMQQLPLEHQFSGSTTFYGNDMHIFIYSLP